MSTRATRRAALVAGAVTLALPIAIAAASQEAPDPGFGDGGYANIDYPADGGGFALNTDSVRVAVDAQGRTIVGTALYDSFYSNDPQAPRRFRLELRRLTTAGALDTSFGVNGVASYGLRFDLNVRPKLDLLQVESDGTITVGVSMPSTSEGSADAAIARLSANGILDTSRGNGGETQDGFSYYATDGAPACAPASPVVLGVAVQSGGALDAAIRDTCVKGFSTGRVVRLNARGQTSPAATFATGTSIAPPRFARFDAVLAAPQTVDGVTRLVVGFATDPQIATRATGDRAPSAASTGLTFARFASGESDPSFGSDGAAETGLIVDTRQTSEGDTPVDLSIDASGRIAALLGLAGDRPKITEVHLTAAGLPQPGFGVGGVVSDDPTDLPGVVAIVHAPDGRTVRAISVRGTVTLTRRNADGTPDATFGANGSVVLPGDQDTGSFLFQDLAIDRDGRLLLSGLPLLDGRPAGDGAAARAAIAQSGVNVARVAAPAPVVPISAPAPTTPASVTPAPIVKQSVPVKVLPSTRKCLSRREFRIRVRPQKLTGVKRIVVKVAGKKVPVVQRDGRYTAIVDLRKLPRSRFSISAKVTFTDPARRTIVDKRTYRTCRTKKESKDRRLPGRP